MPYFCYIHRKTGGVPYFEVLPQTFQDDAFACAERLLSQHADGVRAELWDGDQLIFTLPLGVAAAPIPSDRSSTI